MSAETYLAALREEAARTDLSDDRRKANAAELRKLEADAEPAPEPEPEVETADAEPAPERAVRKRASSRK